MKVWGLSQRDRERHSQLEDLVMTHLSLPSVASSCWKWWICGVAFIALPIQILFTYMRSPGWNSWASSGMGKGTESV